MFRTIADILSPVRFLSHLIGPLAILAAISAAFNWYDLLDHITRVIGTLGFWQKLVIGILSANLLTKLSVGTVMGYYRADSREFGMKLLLGVLPKFYLDRSATKTLDLRSQRSCYAAALMAKLGLFAVGVFCWAMLRRTGSGAADMFLALGVSGFTAFLFIANPLLPFDGCKWLSAWLHRPKLRQNSFRLTQMVATGRRIPADVPATDAVAMIAYTLAAIAFTGFLAYTILSGIALGLEAQFQGTGVVLFCLIVAMVTYFFVSARSFRRYGRQRRGSVHLRTSLSELAHASPTGGPRGAPARRVARKGAIEMGEPTGTPAPQAPQAQEKRAAGREMAQARATGEDSVVRSEPVGPEARPADVAVTQAAMEDGRSGGRWRRKRWGARGAATEPDATTDLSDILGPDTGAPDPAPAPKANPAPAPAAGAAPGGLDELFDQTQPAGADDGADAKDEVEHYLSELDALLTIDEDEEVALEDEDFLEELTGGKSLPPSSAGERSPELDALLNLRSASDAATGEGEPRRLEFRSAATAAQPLLLGYPVPPKPAGPRADAAVARPEPAEAEAGGGATAEAPRGRAARRRELRAAEAASASARGNGDDLDRVLHLGPHRRRPWPGWLRRSLWLAVLVLLAFALTRPYPFEVGGEFIIQPLERAEVRTRTDGEIVELRVKEGDWVEQGQVMAVLSNWDEKRDIAVRQADLVRLGAELESLVEGPSAEEIAVAQQRLTTAQVQHEIEAAEFAQQERLYEAGTITGRALEEARAELRLAEANMAEAEAGLRLTEAAATTSEIAAAEAEIAKHQEDLAFARLKLDQTFVTATVSGQVVSSMAEVPVGTYLPEGGLFAEIQDNRTVIAEIEVPETSIDEVAIGAPVEMRLWSDSRFSVHGTVNRLAPKAEEREFGRVIRVLVEVPNPDGKLTANMTGHGKISAGERPVWQVFTRIIVRFFEVELWSWMP